MSTKVSVLVEIPDGWELACDEMRQAQPGEFHLWCGKPLRNDSGGTTHQPYVIVRKAWQWPEWCTAKELKWCHGRWKRHANGVWWSMHGLDFTPPPDKSKVYRNPNWKEQ